MTTIDQAFTEKVFADAASSLAKKVALADLEAAHETLLEVEEQRRAAIAARDTAVAACKAAGINYRDAAAHIGLEQSTMNRLYNRAGNR